MMKCIYELYVICGMYVESCTILVVVNHLSRPVVVLDGLPGLYGFKYDSSTACGLPSYLYSYKLVGSATSTVEAEYIAAGAYCAQILYMKQTLLDYGVVLEKVPLLCDNESAVNLQIIRFNTLAPST